MTDMLALLLGSTALWGAVATLLVWRGRIRIREIEAIDKRESRAHAAEKHRDDSQQIVTLGAFEALQEENAAQRKQNEALVARLQEVFAEKMTLQARVRRLESDHPPAPDERDTEPERRR